MKPIDVNGVTCECQRHRTQREGILILPFSKYCLRTEGVQSGVPNRGRLSADMEPRSFCYSKGLELWFKIKLNLNDVS